MSSTGTAKRDLFDRYYTPDLCSVELVNLIAPHLPPRPVVVEPSIGGGGFARPLVALCDATVIGVDLDPHAPGQRDCTTFIHGDFLDFNGDFDAVVGNPPYARPSGRFNAKGKPIFEACAELHVRHALTLAPVVGFLLRLAFLEGKVRAPFWEEHPAAEVFVLAERPSFSGGGTDSCAYGFFIFKRGHSGPMKLRVIRWRS